MKRFIGIILIIVLTFSSGTIVNGTTLNETQENLENINDSINSKKNKLQDINSDRKDVQAQISSLDSDANEISGKLSDINDNLASVNKELSTSQKELNIIEDDLQKQNSAFRNRVKAMYTSGSTTYMEVLLSSKGFSDMENKLEWVKKILEYDNNLITSINNNKKALEAKKLALGESKNKAQVLQSDANSQYAELKQKTSEKQKLMASLEKDKSYYEKMIAEEEKEATEIKAIIKKMQSSNSGGSSSGGNTPVASKLYCVTGKIYTITSPYGWRVHPILGTRKFHAGIDIGVYTGTPIHSLKDGVVKYSGVMSGYGNVVMVNHGDIVTVYAHNSVLLVKVGQQVKGGQVISYSGSSGLSSGPHLHFEVRRAITGETVNPISYYVN